MPIPTPLLRAERLLALALGLVLASSAQSAVFVVDNVADAPDTNPGDGICAGFGLLPPNRCSLRAAIMEANEQPGLNLIQLNDFEYYLDETGAGENSAVTGDLDIFGQIELVGTNESEPPIIYQDRTDRVFDVYGGGRLVLRHVFVNGGSTIADPIARLGGAVRVWPDAHFEADTAYFWGNQAEEGGTIYGMGTVVLVDTEISSGFLRSDNPTVNSQGTAISMVMTGQGPATLTMVRSTLSYNGEVVVGPGPELLTDRYALVLRDGAQAHVVNSSFIGNTRGIWVRPGSTLQLFQSTLARNTGTALRFDHDANNPAVQLQIAQTAIVDNGGASECRSADAFFLAPGLSQLQIRNLFNASTDVACGFDGASDVAITGPALFPLAVQGTQTTKTHFLPRPGGGLVDTGGAACLTNEDQRMRPRPVQGTTQSPAHCDIGAVEYDPEFDPPLPPEIFRDGLEG